jgi:hypothetical protein
MDILDVGEPFTRGLLLGNRQVAETVLQQGLAVLLEFLVVAPAVSRGGWNARKRC